MKIGLVGMPSAGKSTVFGALTGLSVQTGFAARGNKENIGTVKVPDPRVEQLAAIYKPKKVTYTETIFTDLGGGTGGGIDRKTLNEMRNVDALCQVVRGFTDDAGEAPDPLKEIDELETECILADLEIVEQRVERLHKERSQSKELEVLERLRQQLESSHPLRRVPLGPDERKLISGYRFLSEKPLLLVLNVAEGDAANLPSSDVAAEAERRGLGLVVLSAQVEMDIAQMSEDEQREFLESLGLTESARDRFIRAAYALLDLISMLTVGPDECRAWPIRRDTRAPQAAGKIHSDIERGFIRAEVIHWRDLVELGSEAKCREAGKQRIEGKNYVVQDGDVINFRFNV